MSLVNLHRINDYLSPDVMNDMPLVSVGIPTYNRPDGLRNCLDAIIKQTYRNLEIIVSDNATPNNRTENVVREFTQIDSRVKYFRQNENKGAIYNFQFVLDKSTGDYFMWAADDDYRAPTYVESLLGELLRCPDCSIAFCDFWAADAEGVKVESYPDFFPFLEKFTCIYKPLRLLRFFFQRETNGKANIIYGLIRRECLKDFTWGEFLRRYGRYGSDMLLVFSLLCNGRLALTKQSLYRSTTGNKKEYTESGANSVMNKVSEMLKSFFSEVRYSVGYLQIAPGLSGILLLLCWPIKFLDISFRFFRNGLRVFYSKVVGSF